MTPFTAEQLTQFWQQRYRDATPLPESVIEAGQRCTLTDGSEATLEPTGWYFYDGGVVSTSDRFPEKETLLIINPNELDAIRSTLLEMVDEVHNMRAVLRDVRARLDTNDIDLDTLIAACLGEVTPPAPAPEQKDSSVALDMKKEIGRLRSEVRAIKRASIEKGTRDNPVTSMGDIAPGRFITVGLLRPGNVIRLGKRWHIIAAVRRNAAGSFVVTYHTGRTATHNKRACYELIR